MKRNWDETKGLDRRDRNDWRAKAQTSIQDLSDQALGCWTYHRSGIRSALPSSQSTTDMETDRLGSAKYEQASNLSPITYELQLYDNIYK